MPLNKTINTITHFAYNTEDGLANIIVCVYESACNGADACAFYWEQCHL